MNDDLISREALIKKIFPYGMPDDGNYPINAKAVMMAITDATDAVIRCKDCKYCNPFGECSHPMLCSDDSQAYVQVSENDFCSFGDRKEIRGINYDD